MKTLSILPNHLFWQFAVIFFKKQIIAFPCSLSRPSWRLVAILELSEHSNSICIKNLLSTCTNIALIKKKQNNIILLTVRCHFTAQWHYSIGDGDHLEYWQPYWKDLNIWTVFITLLGHLLCLKYKIYYHNYLSQPSAALLRQNIGFQDNPWRPYWKMAAILKFCNTHPYPNVNGGLS